MNQKEPDGILAVDKAADMTSHDVVNKIRRLYGTKKVGHTGTLDPMATGLLCVLVGRAAKAAEYLSVDSKTYLCELVLGLTTDTEDIGGAPLCRAQTLPCEADVLSAIASFEGEIFQKPPMYSALKVNGQKLVNLARRGITVDREARKVTVSISKIKRLSEDRYAFTVSCSKGTYIRTLCADIGEMLGCGACMGALRRIQSGAFSLSDAVSLNALEAMTYEEQRALLMPVEALFSDLPVLSPEPFFLRLAKSGAELYQHKIGCAYAVGQRIRLYDENGFFALGEVREYPDGTAVKPIKFFRL